MPDHDMSPAEFRRFGNETVDWIAGYLENTRDYPVLPAVKPGELRDRLPGSAPEFGEPMDAILTDFAKLIVPGITHWNHPRFFAYFSVSASGPGILAEMMAAALNVNGMLWKSSPAVAELEETVLDWLRQWLGLPEGLFGIIYDTASISTMHAIAAAREMADPEARVRGGLGNLAMYTSAQAHSSVEKGAIALGIGQGNVRKIAVDGEFRMDPAALRASIQADLADGRKPFCVVASVGTTSTSSVDPVPAIADAAEEYGLWLHVDGAYGGPAAIVPEYRHLFDGVDRADSVVVNPHKWLFTPIDISVLYTRKPEILRRAFALSADYLKTAEDERVINYNDYGVQLGRRFRALKLWFVLRYFGRDGVVEILRRHIRWAKALAELIAANPRFEVAAPTPLSLICFRAAGPDERSRELMDRVNAAGTAFLSHTVLHGRFTIRLAVGNVRTTWEDLAETWDLIQRIEIDLA